MGRTATACLVLIAVGGCVADDQGPAAAVLAAQQGQPIHASAPSYATWSHADQFAALQDSPPPPPMPVPPPVPAPAPARMTTALKPTAVQKPIIVPGDKTLPGLSQGGLPSEPMVDPDLVQATLVSTPGNADVGVKDGPAKETVVKNAPAKAAPSKATAAKGAPAAAAHPNGSAAEGEQPTAATAAATRMVNSKRITLNYELKDIGSTGVAGVELWTTQDTRTWKKGEIVAETNHSFTVEVKDEGLYGFTLLARNGSGAGKEAPQPGDQPQVWVSVDVTKPVVQITSLELIHGGKTPSLKIRWTAKDKNMGPRPINLSFAEEAEGPWTPIAAGLDNNGQYEWQPTGGLPHHMYVRVEATDLHGNVGAVQSSNPLRIDLASTSVALPPAELPTAAARKPLPLPAPPPLDASRPSAAIMAVEPNSN